MVAFAEGDQLGDPVVLGFVPDGNLYVASFHSHGVLRYDGSTGTFIDVFAADANLTYSAGVLFGPNIYSLVEYYTAVFLMWGKGGKKIESEK
jgi:hypothetical protein